MNETHGKPGPAVWTSPMALSFGLWVLPSLYWAWAARGASAAKSEESALSRGFHLAMINGAMILSYWPFAGWPAVTAMRFEFPRVLPAALAPVLEPIGLAIAAGGMLLSLWARRQLGKNWSGAVTTKVDHELVTSGPYRRIRHPIYTGAILTYFGTALISGRLQGGLAVALIALAYARKIAMEERVLRTEFSEAFERYRRASCALFPGIGGGAAR